MAKLLKVGQFGHTFTRSIQYVETVEQRSHSTGEGSIKLWKFISYFVGFPTIGLTMANCYLRHKEKHGEERPEFIALPYMKIMNKPFPWKDGKHSLFHNPKTNYVPGIGYEE